MKDKNEKWVKVKEYIEHYDLSVALAYQHLHAKNFPCKKVGKRGYRVDLNKTDKWLEQNFN